MRWTARLLLGLLAGVSACGGSELTAPEPFDTSVLSIVPARPSTVVGDTMTFTVTNRASVSVTTATCWDVAWRRDTGNWVTDNALLPVSCPTTAVVTLAPGATRNTVLRVPATARSAQYRVGYLAQRTGTGGTIATASDAFAVLMP